MKEVISNPAPLNSFRDWPYTVAPFPASWLLKFTALGDVPQDAQPDTNSLEQWN